nr:jmjc domain-containing histone demethylation protein 1 [Quercus suber]
MSAYNPCFKRPERDGHSVPPPRAFIEPLSPSPRPHPIEPTFNYPAIASHNNLTAGSEQSTLPSATPKHTSRASKRFGHHRASSSIDALAEAALAASPPHHSRKSSTTVYGLQNHSYLPYPPHDGTSEPPHKRARSDLLPSPVLASFASRPATSYDYSSGRLDHGSNELGYERRVEEAALLLNFKTGGPRSFVQPAPPIVPRPHANSFPRDVYQPRPTDTTLQSGLLPPFNPHHMTEQWPAPAIRQHHEADVEPNWEAKVIVEDTKMSDPRAAKAPVPSEPPVQQLHTPPDESESCARNSEISEPLKPVKAKRGWPKGKPRGTGAKKTVANKAVAKRATTRKATLGSSKGAKRTQQVNASALGAAESRISQARRKSFGDFCTTLESAPTTFMRRSKSVPPDVLMQIRGRQQAKPTRRQLNRKVDTICAGCSITRKTATSHGEMDEWISCNGCKNWFHIDCAGFKKALEVKDVDKFFCGSCESEHGKTTYVRKSTRAHASVDYAELQKGVLKTSEDSQEHHYIQPIKDGTFTFDEKTFRIVRPEMVTRDIFERSDLFTEPLCIPAEFNPRPWERGTKEESEVNKEEVDNSVDASIDELLPDDFEYDSVPDHGQDKLDMVMPENLTVRQVCNLVGADYPLDVIDVKTQNSGGKWNLGRWADYYEDEGEDKSIRNVISLEVSQTKLGRLLRRPKIVRDIDLQDSVWPQEERDKGKWPNVQFYCLMSVADSYTDFHIDFGGSSVYYHILKGKKTFFFIPPKPKHLKAYEEWNESPEQNFTFLPHITKECYRVDLKEGDTMLIPSGWIHAVWTPETSLVIGGNFLTRMSFQNQFKVVEVEQNNHTPMKFRYPFFQRIMWYTVLQYLTEDPLPREVSQLLHSGERFERTIPIWQDFDGDVAANDPRPGARNARYYSKAELDGLPDLAAYVFRTVMLVLGRVEGVTQDRMRRVNTGIPKGHGEPLELARRFGEWVAWKRSEDPPAWAHPDSVLPNEEGPQKKLSARALKEMERTEAMAASRLAPGRQSGRLIDKASTNQMAKITPPPSQKVAPEPQPRPESPGHQNHQFSPSHPSDDASPNATMISTISAPYVSTPKTSVLGPKRVACDACRRRRIRCKHKDLVTQIPFGIPIDPSMQPHFSPEYHDNISIQQRNHLDGSPNSANGTPLFATDEHRSPQPGTNAYINANIPMTMNGVAMFGDAAKRGRSKACFDCRKSKRRCVHDENGNVDPVKAAENPVPRGPVPSRKRQSTEDPSPPQMQKKPKAVESDSRAPAVQFAEPMQGVLKLTQTPGFATMENGANVNGSSKPYFPQDQPPLDPDLFNLSGENHHDRFSDNPFHDYQATEQSAAQYQLQSLEQIANEVLDMNGSSHEQSAFHMSARDLPHTIAETQAHDHSSPQQDGTGKSDGSVDSAVSLLDDRKLPDFHHTNKDTSPHDTIELKGAVGEALHSSNDASQSLPLYQPPAPISSQSPELKRRRLANGTGHEKNASTSSLNELNAGLYGSHPSNTYESEDERLARLLQQEDLGLRARH